jgi:hypothetical protein
MSQSKSQVPAGFPKRTMSFEVPVALTATSDPHLRFTAQMDMMPLSLRCTPITEFDRTTEDETYVLSMEDDTTKITTDNAAVTTALKTATIEATFTAGTKIAKGSIVEIILTLGGTTPIVPARSVIEFDYLEGLI